MKPDTIPMSHCEPYIQMYGGLKWLVEELADGELSKETFLKRVVQLLRETQATIEKGKP